jgi:hypothetical protein
LKEKSGVEARVRVWERRRRVGYTIKLREEHRFKHHT